jgi:hypothetical protein
VITAEDMKRFMDKEEALSLGAGYVDLELIPFGIPDEEDVEFITKTVIDLYRHYVGDVKEYSPETPMFD